MTCVLFYSCYFAPIAGNPADPATWLYIAPCTNGIFDEGDNITVLLLTLNNTLNL